MNKANYQNLYLVKDIGKLDKKLVKNFIFSKNPTELNYRMSIRLKKYDNCLLSQYNLTQKALDIASSRNLKCVTSYKGILLDSVGIIEKNMLYVTNRYSSILLSLKNENKNILCNIENKT